MPKYELKIEESFLQSAKDGGVPLRVSLANRERLSGLVSVVGRYDLNIDSDGKIITILKKEIFHISPQRQLLDEAFFSAAVPDEVPAGKSRVQDEFLARYIKEKTLALLRMTNGEELRGVVEGYDGFTIALKTSRGQVLMYKHGLCCIAPGYRRHGREDEQ